jgi:hypothetical protein
MCSEITEMKFICDILKVPSTEAFDLLSDLQDKYAEYKRYRNPLVDFDNDGFGSQTEGVRGTWWKGKDCRYFII